MIAIVDYRMGNLGSIANMFKKLNVPAEITNDITAIQRAERIVLPGVGSFDTGMNNLNDLGLIDVLNEKVLVQKAPVLGICLGMQLFFNSSGEGRAKGLGWIEGECLRFPTEIDGKPLKVPHIGWNYIEKRHDHSILAKADENTRFYFVHSFFVKARRSEDVLATSEYGLGFDSIVAKENVVGVQFHPEKSHRFGMELLKNFSSL